MTRNKNQWQRQNLSSRGGIGPFLGKMAKAMTANQYSGKEILALGLALEGAIENAVVSPRCPNKPFIQGRFLVKPDQVLVDIREKACLTSVRFKARGDCVTMSKCRFHPCVMPNFPSRTRTDDSNS